MKFRTFLALLAVGILPTTGAVSAQGDMEAPPGLPGFGWLSDLAGSCWTGAMPDGKMMDTQCYGTQYGRFLRGTIQLATQGDDSGKTPHEGDSIWVWDAKKRSFSFYYWSNNGSFGVSEGFMEGEVIRFPDPPKVDAKAPPTRSTWVRLDENSFRVIREKKEKGLWKETLAVVYTRVAP